MSAQTTQLESVPKQTKRAAKAMATLVETKQAPQAATQKTLVHQFFYSIPDLLEIPTQHLEALANACGLDQRLLPREIREASAFKRAVESLQKNKTEQVGSGDSAINVCTSISVVPVPDEPRMRHIEKKTRRGSTSQATKKEATKPETTVIGSIEYDATEGLIFHCEAVDLSEIRDFEAMEQEVRASFQHCMTHYSDRDIRNIMTRALRDLNAVTFRGSGGVFVCPVESSGKLDSLVSFLEGLETIRLGTVTGINKPKDGSEEKEVEIFSVPLANEARVVARVAKCLISTILRECDVIERKAEAWMMDEDGIPLGRLKEMEANLRYIEGLHETYDGFLGANLGQATQRLQRASGVVKKLAQTATRGKKEN